MRPLHADDVDRVAELVESTLTASYRLSPQQIDAMARELFDAETLQSDIDADDTVVLVAEVEGESGDPVVAGFVKGTIDDGGGEIRWLVVDPEYRGQGLGTELFESARSELRDRGVEEISATVLEASTGGHQFVERFGLERVGEDRVELGGERLTSYRYADPDAEGETVSEAAESQSDETTFPETETHGGKLTATDEEGQRVFIARDERLSGTESPFFVAYADEAADEQFGIYCGNCGSLSTTMGAMERIECEECGNTSTSRGSEEYDDSYL